MKYKVTFLWVLIFGISFSFAKTSSIERGFSEETKNLFLKEADDLIDNLSEGDQDRKSDAVFHALRSQNEELKNYRATVDNYFSDDNINSDTSEIIYIPIQKGSVEAVFYNKSSIETSKPLLIFFHGGGWNLGSAKMSASFCNELVKNEKVRVLSVTYPLTPETGYDDIVLACREVYEYVCSNKSKFGVSDSDISIGGEGAGGNLALESVFSQLQQNINSVNSLPENVILFYPLINTDINKSKSWRKYGRGYGFDVRLAEAFYTSINEEKDRKQILEKITEAENFPNVVLISAGRDIVLDEGQAFINILKEKNLNAIGIILEGSVHGFLVDKKQKTAFNEAVKITEEILSEY